MSKFWQQDSSSEDEKSDNDSVADKPTVNRLATNEKRFASTFIDDSDSGWFCFFIEYSVFVLLTLFEFIFRI